MMASAQQSLTQTYRDTYSCDESLVASKFIILSGSAFCFSYVNRERVSKAFYTKTELWLFIKYVVNMFLILWCDV